MSIYWISTDDELPKVTGMHVAGERVLIYNGTWKEIFIANRVWTNSNDWCWMDEEDYVYSPEIITHFMPLPEPPQ